MILVRAIFQAKYGKGDELVALLKEASSISSDYNARLMTDLSGPFFTVVAEEEFENFAAWEKRNAEMFSMPEFQDWFARATPLVESGSREFYTIVE